MILVTSSNTGFVDSGFCWWKQYKMMAYNQQEISSVGQILSISCCYAREKNKGVEMKYSEKEKIL